MGVALLTRVGRVKVRLAVVEIHEAGDVGEIYPGARELL
jgi:hypothetical protein